MRGFGSLQRLRSSYYKSSERFNCRNRTTAATKPSTTTIMNSLVVFASIVGVTVAQYWGMPHPVSDTPEVAAAKTAHLAAVAAAKMGIHYVPSPIHYAPYHHYDAPQKKWTGPIALPSGYDKHGAPLPVPDTPEVAAEKAKHYELYSHGAHAASAARYAMKHVVWTPVAAVWGAHDVPADTPEVAAAKAAHFAAHAARTY